MNPDIIVEIVKDAEKKNNPVATLIGYDDCTSFQLPWCKMWSNLHNKVRDTNHVKIHF